MSSLVVSADRATRDPMRSRVLPIVIIAVAAVAAARLILWGTL